MENIEFIVPWPPSANSLYVNENKLTLSQPKDPLKKAPRYYQKRRLSKEGINFTKYVKDLLGYTFPRVKYGSHPVFAYITLYPPDKRRRDHPNCEKVLYDAIQKSGIINDDRQFLERKSSAGVVVKDGLIHVSMGLWKGDLKECPNLEDFYY